MSEMCTDNRYEVIAAYKKKLIECTNIETNPDEMAVIDNLLFRFWQLGWLPPVPHGRLIDADAYEQLLYSLGNRDYRREKGSIQDAIKFLHPNYAPTIIPTEKNGCGRCDHCRINETGTCRYAEENEW